MGKTTILYTSDIHGSNLSFRKAVNTAIQHKVDALVIGGDIAGKTLVPVIHRADGFFEAELVGKQERASAGPEVERLEMDLANTGSYTVRVTEEQHELLKHEDLADEKRFYPLMEKRLKHWLWLAEYKLKPNNIRLVMICGNDDPWLLDRIINHSAFTEDPEYQTVTLGENHEVVGESRGNPTPFDCPRDTDEFTLEKSIRDKIAKVKDIRNAVFMLHIPPYETDLDKAYELDKDLKLRTRGPGALLSHVGSKAVRNVIEEFQPLIALHGHIHESQGITSIGRTLCFNPGSEYWRGIMHAFLITLEDDAVRHLSIIG